MGSHSDPRVRHLEAVELRVTMAGGMEGFCCYFPMGMLDKGDRDGRVEQRCDPRIRLELGLKDIVTQQIKSQKLYLISSTSAGMLLEIWHVESVWPVYNNERAGLYLGF